MSVRPETAVHRQSRGWPVARLAAVVMATVVAVPVVQLADAQRHASADTSTPLGQLLDWTGQGDSTTTIGPGQPIDIVLGQIAYENICAPGGTNDFIYPAADIYIVPSGSEKDGQKLSDVSGSANTIIAPASGGAFADEIIGYTAPVQGGSGGVGPGVYDIVYDECQDGNYSALVDAVFQGALTVTENTANIPPLDMTAQKSAWSDDAKQMEKANDDLKKRLEALRAEDPDPLDKLIEGLGTKYPFLADPVAVANLIAAQALKHVQNLAADPPDPAYNQPTTLDPATVVPPGESDPVIQAANLLGTETSSTDALNAGLLHAVERYQGAAAAHSGSWALTHVREIAHIAQALSVQEQRQADAYGTLAGAISGDTTHDIDGSAAVLSALSAQVKASGFTADQVRTLRNAGATQAQIVQLVSDLAAEDWTGFSNAGTAADMVATQSSLNTLASSMAAFASEADGIVLQLATDPSVGDDRPLADAGGSYSGTAGAPITLSATASVGARGNRVPITSYQWDLNGDGVYGDATGSTVTNTWTQPYDGVVGVKVTSDWGYVGYAWANVHITSTQHLPSIATAPDAGTIVRLAAGSSQTFTPTITNPDNEPLSLTWSLDGTPVPGAPTPFTYTSTSTDVGFHGVTVAATNTGPLGGTISATWRVLVSQPDADGDGWDANVDCNDQNPNVNPGEKEIINNGIDDDCNPATPDAGIPPTAAFTSSQQSGTLTTSFDGTSSTAPNGTVAGYAWDFGDGTNGNGATPTHAYAAPGNYDVKLTVTDSVGETGSTTIAVTVAQPPPTASFTVAPSGGVAPLDVAVDASASTAVDGSITADAWDFGDGSTASGVTAHHTYAKRGNYTITLTITDNLNRTATASRPLGVTQGSPTAAITFDKLSGPAPLTVNLDASSSRAAPGGTIVRYDWNSPIGTWSGPAFSPTFFSTANSGTITLTVTDDAGQTATTSVQVTVLAPIPVANDDTMSALVHGFADVLANDHEYQGGTLTLTSFTQPAHGSVTCSPAGACNYVANGGFTGSDAFTYTVTDPIGQTATANVAVTVNGPLTGTSPVAQNDAVIVPPQAPSAAVNVLLNDTAGSAGALTVSSATQPAHGSVVCAPAGTCTYAPSAGFSGHDGFAYQATDPANNHVTAIVDVTVGAATDGFAALATGSPSPVDGGATARWTVGANPTPALAQDVAQTVTPPPAITATLSAGQALNGGSVKTATGWTPTVTPNADGSTTLRLIPNGGALLGDALERDVARAHPRGERRLRRRRTRADSRRQQSLHVLPPREPNVGGLCRPRDEPGLSGLPTRCCRRCTRRACPVPPPSSAPASSCTSRRRFPHTATDRRRCRFLCSAGMRQRTTHAG